MSAQPKIYLNLYWHMHQPDYRDTLTGEYVLPWTYLHAIKDYTDMAHHLETNARARITFNFVPVLLEQLEDYRQQFESGDVRDPLLALLIGWIFFVAHIYALYGYLKSKQRAR